VSEQRALAALGDLPHSVLRHGPVRSLEDAADYLFVLVPGDRQLSWPKLRAVLGVSRLSLPPADEALEATGYERGTITPFGSTTAWPVVADSAVVGQEITLGGGAHGVAVKLQADDALAALAAQVADVTE
jgi:prolyl-tRNA editing enzyme YbaK/EbsC (Cys-tRNA(Pro) deacylase)